jgi:large subunit ribosomal protein L18
MDNSVYKKQQRNRRHARVRSKVSGTEQRPRLSVFRSNKALYVQLIDDVNGNTLAALDDRTLSKGTPTEKAQELGALIAKKAQEKGIESVVFDRGGYLYAGRIKMLAESARNAGLNF